MVDPPAGPSVYCRADRSGDALTRQSPVPGPRRTNPSPPPARGDPVGPGTNREPLTGAHYATECTIPYGKQNGPEREPTKHGHTGPYITQHRFVPRGGAGSAGSGSAGRWLRIRWAARGRAAARPGAQYGQASTRSAAAFASGTSSSAGPPPVSRSAGHSGTDSTRWHAARTLEGDRDPPLCQPQGYAAEHARVSPAAWLGARAGLPFRDRQWRELSGRPGLRWPALEGPEHRRSLQVQGRPLLRRLPTAQLLQRERDRHLPDRGFSGVQPHTAADGHAQGADRVAMLAGWNPAHKRVWSRTGNRQNALPRSVSQLPAGRGEARRGRRNVPYFLGHPLEGG